MNGTLTSEAFLGSIGLSSFDRDKHIQEKNRQLEMAARDAAKEAERKFKEEYYKSDDIRYASFDRPSKNAADADQQGAIIYSSKLNEETQKLQADFAKEFSAREAQSRISRDELDEATTPADVRAAKAVVLLNENALRDGALQYTKDQERDLKWIAEPDSGKAVDALQKQARLDEINRDNLIARKNDILEHRRAAHIAAEDDRINNGALSASAALDEYKSYSNEEIQRLQNSVEENNNIWGRLSGKHGKAQEALKDFKAESEAELKRLEEEAKPRPFDEQKANKDLDALISKHSDAADASQKALDEARQKAREEGVEKAKALRKQAEQKQKQVPNQPKPVEAPVQAPEKPTQQPEVPRAEPEKPAEQPTQVPEQKEPEQPLRDQVPPDQKAPAAEPLKPEPQQAPEQPQPEQPKPVEAPVQAPEKPVQKPDAPIQRKR